MLGSLTIMLLGLIPIPGGVAEEIAFAEFTIATDRDKPAMRTIEHGASSWITAAGPEAATLEQCDLGLGPGVVEGAYAQLPRYFEDVGRVMDVEARLEHCLVTIQGRSSEAIHGAAYSNNSGLSTELEALVTWIASKSEGLPIAASQEHPQEQAAFALGRQLFYYRAGPHDFSCASCHGQSDIRIRLQQSPNLSTTKGAAAAYRGWPAYLFSQGLVRTLGWQLRDCMRRQRLPELRMGSEASVALQTFLAVQASGSTMAAPGLKR